MRCWILFICMKLIHLCSFFLIGICPLFYSLMFSNGLCEIIWAGLFCGSIGGLSLGSARKHLVELMGWNTQIEREGVIRNWLVNWGHWRVFGSLNEVKQTFWVIWNSRVLCLCLCSNWRFRQRRLHLCRFNEVDE